MDSASERAKIKAGGKPFDAILILKTLLIQFFYNLSDDVMEYQMNDRFSFKRFLKLTLIKTSYIMKLKI